MTVREVFEAMPAAFQKDAAKGLTAVFQFDISGEGGGKWYVEVVNGEMKLVEGEHPTPGVTMIAAAPDYVAVSNGKLNPMLAVATGKLKTRGNLGLAMKLQQIFKR